MKVAETSNEEGFKTDLKAHQNGQTDYTVFCNDAAKSGIEKWVVRMDEMTCTYLNQAGNKIMVEKIPR